MANLHLQLKRFNGAFSTRTEAVNAINNLSGKTDVLKEGEPILAAYHTVDNDEKSNLTYILGFKSTGNESPSYIILDQEGTKKDILASVTNSIENAASAITMTGLKDYDKKDSETVVAVTADDKLLTAIEKLIYLHKQNATNISANASNINSLQTNKQDKLTAGDGITLDGSGNIQVTEDEFVKTTAYTNDKTAIATSAATLTTNLASLSSKTVASITSNADSSKEETSLKVTATTLDDGTKSYNLAVKGDDIIFNNPKFGLEYNSNNKRIYIVPGASQDKTVDASAFIKDGMIDSVTISDDKKSIIITWNTDAGKESTTINLKDLIQEFSFDSNSESTANKVAFTVGKDDLPYSVEGTINAIDGGVITA